MMDMHFTIGNVISLISMVIVGVGGFWKINSSLKDSVNTGIKEVEDKFTKALHEHVKEEDEKRARMYARMDEIKKSADDKFASKDIINVMHEGTAKNLASLEAKLDKMQIDFKTDLNDVRKGQNDLRETILKSALHKQS